MRWYFGYPVLAAGLAFATHTFLPGEPDVSLAREGLWLVAAGPVEAPPTSAATVARPQEIHSHPHSRLASFSPGARLMQADVPPPRPTMLEYLAQAFLPPDPVPPIPVPAVVDPVAADAWKSVVIPVAITADARPIEPRQTVAQRALLAREVQSELRRVGCYWGEIDGIWGPGSQRAAMSFMERVNALLPAEEPDVFMLSLLAQQSDAVCGATCPQGQALATGGRCLPTTLLAQANSETHTTRHHSARAAAPLHSEFADDAPAPAVALDAPDTWETVVAEATVTSSTRRSLPLHNRMGVGGPRPEDREIVVPIQPSRVATLPSASDRLERTAVLDLPVSGVEDVVSVAPSLASITAEDVGARPTAAVQRPRAKAAPTAQKARPERAERSRRVRGNYRQVQRLFEHPLGRM